MQSSAVTWDTPLAEPPGPDDLPELQSDQVLMMVFDFRYPERSTLADFWAVAYDLDYPWPSVQRELKRIGLNLSNSVKNGSAHDAVLGEDVPITLKRDQPYRAIGTKLERWRRIMAELKHDEETLGGSSKRCDNGVGALLADRSHPTVGRDMQLPCKRRLCPSCGPRGRTRSKEKMLKDFGRGRVNVVVLDDGGEEWEAFHKTHIERGGASYHRIPAPEGKAVVFTTADVGEQVENIEEVIDAVLDLQPCDGRRRRFSQDWKELRAKRWKLVGRTRMAQEDRKAVYEDEGLNPTEVRGTTPEAVLSAYDVRLPADGPELDHLKERLDMAPPQVEGW